MLFCCSPIGLVLVWVATKWEQRTKMWVTIGVVAFWAIYGIVAVIADQAGSSTGAFGVIQ